MNLSRFSDVTVKPEEFEVADICVDGKPLDYKKSNRFIKKEMKVPFIDGLENLESDSFTSALENGGACGHVDCANWPASWPGRPECVFHIARCREGLAVLFDVKGETVRAKEKRDGGRIWEDSCCGVLLNRYLIEISASGAISSPQITVSELSSIKRWASQHNGNEWSAGLLIPYSFVGLNPDSLPGKVDFNAHKRADLSSNPHYLTWNPVGTRSPDFQRQEYSGVLIVKF